MERTALLYKKYSWDAINLYRLKKLNILDSKLLTSVDLKDFVKKYLGIHSARIGKPFISLLNKGFDLHISKLFEIMNESNNFLQKRCMRKTLHICHTDDLETLHYSTKKIRISGMNFTEKVLSNSSAIIHNFFSTHEFASKKEIYDILHDVTGINGLHVNKLLQYHYENGLLYFKNISTNVFKEIRAYSLLRKILDDDLTIEKEEQPFIKKLVLQYIICFGPVTINDICWWTGLSKKKITIAIESIANLLFFVTSEGIQNNMIIIKTEECKINEVYEKYRNIHWCKFMSFEDSALKAYYETRCLYVSNQKKYFNPIGEIYATILFDGKCIGIWDIDQKLKKINYSIDNSFLKFLPIINDECKRLELLLF